MTKEEFIKTLDKYNLPKHQRDIVYLAYDIGYNQGREDQILKQLR